MSNITYVQVQDLLNQINAGVNSVTVSGNYGTISGTMASNTINPPLIDPNFPSISLITVENIFNLICSESNPTITVQNGGRSQPPGTYFITCNFINTPYNSSSPLTVTYQENGEIITSSYSENNPVTFSGVMNFYSVKSGSNFQISNITFQLPSLSGGNSTAIPYSYFQQKYLTDLIGASESENFFNDFFNINGTSDINCGGNGLLCTYYVPID